MLWNNFNKLFDISMVTLNDTFLSLILLSKAKYEFSKNKLWMK